MLWNHGLKALQDFVKHLNSCHPTLTFTFEYCKVSIPILDTTITVGLDRKLYYLHYCSCHPHHQKTGRPYSQLLRVKCICAKNTDFEQYAHKTMGDYKLRGYTESVVHSAWNKSKSIDRTILLTIREEDETPEEAPLVCITQYHPQNPPIQVILKMNWPTLEIYPKLNTISDKRVVFGHKRGKNLWDILVQSKLSSPPLCLIPRPR